jgi:hypothetical protein
MSRVKTVLGSINRALDFRAAPTNFSPPAEVWFGCVYRQRNWNVLSEVTNRAIQDGWNVHLWALDRTAPELEVYTRGEGAGGKFALLQRLVDLSAPSPTSWTVFSDDDYRLRRGSLRDLVAIAVASGFDVAQPAHHRFVNASHHITLVRPRMVSRRTHFVEIGPVVAFSPSGRTNLLPFPSSGMGWGLEAHWSMSSLRGENNLGIVDAVTIEHLGRVAQDYDLSEARSEYQQLLTEAGLSSLSSVQVNVASWSRFRKDPPWRRHDSSL